MNAIVQFWANSYRSDKVAFGFELTSFVFTVLASSMLAVNAVDPDLRIIYPFFFIGSTTQCYAAYRRGAAWVMLLTAWFVCVNVLGFLVAMGWI
ncbi:MAG: hypothetical protein CMA64_09155 [Euryarchaeota archaeon]|jgi:hypothetical protein|nr:hypothetical protein [Euryarchaeota archaeon]